MLQLLRSCWLRLLFSSHSIPLLPSFYRRRSSAPFPCCSSGLGVGVSPRAGLHSIPSRANKQKPIGRFRSYVSRWLHQSPHQRRLDRASRHAARNNFVHIGHIASGRKGNCRKVGGRLQRQPSPVPWEIGLHDVCPRILFATAWTNLLASSTCRS